MSHSRNLSTLQWNLDRARAYAETNPTEWNLTRVADLTQALADYRRYMAGEIERHQMCWTAIGLTMHMPEWGTYGT